MIVEVALITVRPGSEAEFLGAFQEAQKILASSSGYRSHPLGRSIEAPNRFA